MDHQIFRFVRRLTKWYVNKFGPSQLDIDHSPFIFYVGLYTHFLFILLLYLFDSPLYATTAPKRLSDQFCYTTLLELNLSEASSSICLYTALSKVVHNLPTKFKFDYFQYDVESRVAPQSMELLVQILVCWASQLFSLVINIYILVILLFHFSMRNVPVFLFSLLLYSGWRSGMSRLNETSPTFIVWWQ